jgi:hypothetical protein
MDQTPAISLPTHGELTETSFTLPPAITQDQWEIIGQKLNTVDSGIHWWVGDWFVYGLAQYGDDVWNLSAVIERWGYEALQNIVRVAKRIPSPRRHSQLSWSHHNEVSSFAELKDQDQDDFLDQAEEHGWSTRELRKAIRDSLEAKGEDLVTVSFKVSTEEKLLIDITLALCEKLDTNRDDKNENLLAVLKFYREQHQDGADLELGTFANSPTA